MVTVAAVKIYDKRQEKFVILPCHKHSQAYETLYNLGYKTTEYIWKATWQGFLNEHGEYLTRQEAAREAFKCGQIKELSPGQELYSEDLW